MKKVGIFLIGVLAVIGISLGGWKVKEIIEHQEMAKIVKSEEAQKIYEDELKFIDENALTDDGIIKSYQIDSFEQNPMGGIIVYLRINDNKNYSVTVFLGKMQDKIVGEGGSWSPELSDSVKKETSND
ncbi:DUF1310 family protein [Streptococcus loxodontisalivarius]|uniref:DUF1310 family protein n=1 Tax=Streptococcus loxodontisalivarius TaxID=1349415 RepID=A0ABS2PTQ3_9STRE|nr:DUF1310 family protein [Streptococcus loxodontisalivarius]MBM7642742.1 hypothetical protein [Streptococcus loxodontisalivarius]